MGVLMVRLGLDVLCHGKYALGRRQFIQRSIYYHKHGWSVDTPVLDGRNE